MVNVKGKTIDDQGYLPFVNIYEVGTNNSTQTALDGSFSINVSNSNSALRFSFVGYAPVTLSVAEVLNEKIIQLYPDNELLDEVVVPVPPKDDQKKGSNLWLILLGIGVASVVVAVAVNSSKKEEKKVKANPGLKEPKEIVL